MRKISFWLFWLSVLLVVLGYLWWQASRRVVVFCAVGEGDGILIKDGLTEFLIDVGPPNGRMKQCLEKFLPFFDRKIEYLLASHYDKDHIGGIEEVAKVFRIEKVLGYPACRSFSKNIASWTAFLHQHRLQEEIVFRGRVFCLPHSQVQILYPLQDTPCSRNLSVLARLNTPKRTFLFTGDLENSHWQKIFSLHLPLSADILKAPHHGSRGSFSLELLARVQPQEVVISVGKNRYGHPHPEVIRALEEKKVRYRRTDQQGNVVYSF